MFLKITFYGIGFGAIRAITLSFSVFYILGNNISIIELGIIKTFQSFLIFFLDIPLSYFADKYSRKFSIVLGAFLSTVWLVMMSSANSFSLFLIAEFFNSLSLILFNGAFIAYFIDHSSVKHIVVYEKYDNISMAIFSFIGSLFVSVDSKFIWFLSGLFMFLCMLYGLIFLPKDNSKHQNLDQSNKFINDIKYVNNLIFNNNYKFKFIFILYIASLLFMQIIIQFWQPYTFGIDPEFKAAIWYGMFFSCILFMQSLASFFYEKFNHNKYFFYFVSIVSIIAFLVSISAIFYNSKILTILSTLILFFISKLILLINQIDFHEKIESNLRATIDSIVSSSYRILLLIFLPIVTFFIDINGWYVIPILLLLLNMLYIILNKILRNCNE